MDLTINKWRTCSSGINSIAVLGGLRLLLRAFILHLNRLVKILRIEARCHVTYKSSGPHQICLLLFLSIAKVMSPLRPHPIATVLKVSLGREAARISCQANVLSLEQLHMVSESYHRNELATSVCISNIMAGTWGCKASRSSILVF